MQGTSDWDSGPGSGSGWSQETTAERANDRCSHAPAGSLFLLPLALRRIQSSLVSVVSRRGIPRAIAPRRHCSRSQNRLSQDRYNLPFPLCCVSAVWDQIIALASAAAARYPSVHVLAAAALRAGACGPGHAQGPTAIARVLPCGYETDRRWAQLPMTFRARPRPICTLDSRRTTSDVLEDAVLRGHPSAYRTHKKNMRALRSAHISRYRASRYCVRPAWHRGNPNSVARLPLTRSALCFPDRSSGHRKYALTPSCRPLPGTSGASGINANAPDRRLGAFAP